MNCLENHGAIRSCIPIELLPDILEAIVRGQHSALLAEADERSLPGLVRLEVDAEPAECQFYLVYRREVRRLARVRWWSTLSSPHSAMPYSDHVKGAARGTQFTGARRRTILA